MYSYLTKNGSSLAFGLGLLITVLFLVSIFTGLDAWSLIPEDSAERYDTTIFNLGLIGSMALAVACAAAILVFGIYQLATNFKGAIKGIAGLAFIVIAYFVLSGMSTPNPALAETLSQFDISDALSSSISGGIGVTILLVTIAVLSTFIFEIINFFK